MRAAVGIIAIEFPTAYASDPDDYLAKGLALRDRSEGRVSLDDFMRALWTTFGRPGGRVPGVVDRPYTLADVETTLASVAGDAGFARDFLTRFVNGHDVVDYAALVQQAGLVLRPASTRGFVGLSLQDTVEGPAVSEAPGSDTPMQAT